MQSQNITAGRDLAVAGQNKKHKNTAKSQKIEDKNF